MTREKTVKGKMGGLQRLLERLSNNREELPHLEASRVRFEALLAQLQEAANRQAVHTAAKQEASQELQTLLTEGERMATVLQLGVKQHYGIRAEKLVDFGLKPFRGRKRKAAEPNPSHPAGGAGARAAAGSRNRTPVTLAFDLTPGDVRRTSPPFHLPQGCATDSPGLLTGSAGPLLFGKVPRPGRKVSRLSLSVR